MTRIANTKIVFEDGSVQWVMERTVGDTTYFENVYFSVQAVKLRDYCAYRLRKARHSMRVKTLANNIKHEFVKHFANSLLPQVKKLADKVNV